MVLLRALGLRSAVLLVVGSVIGSAVFLVTSEISQVAGSPALALLIWLLAGAVSLAGGLIFAELGAMYPGSGGHYLYLSRAFGNRLGFLYSWTNAWVIHPGTLAALAVAIPIFLGAVLPLGPLQVKLVASGAVLVLTMVNLLGVRRGAALQDVLTALKLLAIAIIVIAAFFAPGSAELGFAELPDRIREVPLSAIGVAFIATFWAFEGWHALGQVAGELKRPRRDVPLALGLGIGIILTIYLLMNLAYYRTLPIQAISESAFVAGDTAAALWGTGASRLVSVLVVVSTLGCLASTVLAGARVTFACAADGQFPRWLAYVDPRHRVPSGALMAQGLWAIVLIWSGSYEQLFTYVIGAAFLFYGLTAAALIRLRQREPEADRPFLVPLYPVLPLLYIAFVLAFVLNAVVEKPWESLAGFGIVLLGVPVHAWTERRRRIRTELPVPAAPEGSGA